MPVHSAPPPLARPAPFRMPRGTARSALVVLALGAGAALPATAGAAPTPGSPTANAFFHSDAVAAGMLPWTTAGAHKAHSFPAPAGKTNLWWKDKSAGGIQQVRGKARLPLYTELLARTPQGGRPNAPAEDPDISWDHRIAEFMSFTSAATDITPGTDGHRNVYLVPRQKGGWRADGSPWHHGGTKLVSKGLGGPANGDSWGARLAGSVNQRPKQLAFVSAASNLVKGDTNGRPDVFVRNTSSSKLVRVPSRTSAGASAVAIAGQRAMRGEDPSIIWVDGKELWFLEGGPKSKPKRLARGAISNPDMTYTGIGFTFERDGWIYAGNTRTGKVRRVVKGKNSSADGGAFWPNRRPFGEVRFVTYEADGRINNAYVGTRYNRKTKRIDYAGGRKISVQRGFSGAHPATATGGPQVLFAHGPFVYGWLTNQPDIRQAQAVCPVGSGDVTDLQVSHTWNYIAYQCANGALYFSYMGPYR